MARIRSIKPEFFLDETMAQLPISARLTFLGLLTYVDDNGVGLDNERLIMAALYPLDEDLIGTLQRLREDLRSLSGVARITRYTYGSKRYIHVTHFAKHQKVSHPRASRYPLPDEPGLTSTDVDSGEAPESSGETPERLRPDQGSGIRDQGSFARLPDDPSPTDDKSAASGGQTIALIEDTPPLTAGLLVTAWCDGFTAATNRKPPAPSVKSVAGRCKSIAKATPVTDINAWRDAWQAARDAGKAQRLDVLGQLTDNGRSNRRPEKSAAAFLDLANELPNFDAIGA